MWPRHYNASTLADYFAGGLKETKSKDLQRVQNIARGVIKR
jgi:hypothetical protein